MSDPLTPFLKHQGILVLDGGLATEFEARGCDLNEPAVVGQGAAR